MPAIDELLKKIKTDKASPVESDDIGRDAARAFVKKLFKAFESRDVDAGVDALYSVMDTYAPSPDAAPDELDAMEDDGAAEVIPVE